MNIDDDKKAWYCYFLYSSEGQTYIGATIDPDRRLRQHNGELSGGARATCIRVAQGQTWKRMCYVQGFPDKTSALQFEWRWKSLSRKKEYASLTPVDRRIQALYELIALDRPTSKATCYSEYPKGSVEIIWE